ncbi:MAG: hypothetical protein K2Y35_19080 [Burkholderiales bacterium]|nr:hypothetical protein [Burkholderiales bacterium]
MKTEHRYHWRVTDRAKGQVIEWHLTKKQIERASFPRVTPSRNPGSRQGVSPKADPVEWAP